MHTHECVHVWVGAANNQIHYNWSPVFSCFVGYSGNPVVFQCSVCKCSLKSPVLNVPDTSQYTDSLTFSLHSMDPSLQLGEKWLVLGLAAWIKTSGCLASPQVLWLLNYLCPRLWRCPAAPVLDMSGASVVSLALLPSSLEFTFRGC